MEIDRVVLATTDMAAMVTFYDQVFRCGLTPTDASMPDSFHAGTFAGISLLLCPNAVAEVDARQNRHQFGLLVPDLDAAVAAVERCGGRIVNELVDAAGVRSVGVSDPDGNTYELSQSAR